MSASAPPTSRLRRPARFGVLLVAIVAIAIGLRLTLILMKGQAYHFADTAEYDVLARAMLSGHPAPGQIPRAPLFPAFMALGYALFGVGDLMAVRMMQLLLGGAIVALVAWLGRRMAGPVVGLLAGTAAALAPTLVYTCSMLYPSLLYTALLLALTVLAWRMARAPSLPLGLALGLAGALLMLTDMVAAAPLAATLAWLVLPGDAATARRLRAVGVAVLVVVGLVAGWERSLPRGGSGEGAFLAKAQYVLWVARHEEHLIGGHRVADPADSTFHPLGPGVLLRRELRLLRTQPGAYLHDYGYEFAHYFAPMPDRLQTVNIYTGPAARWLVALYFLPVVPLALIGAFAGRASRRDRWLLALIPVATALLYALFFTQMRYRVPTEPHLLLLAALGLERLRPAGRGARESGAS